MGKLQFLTLRDGTGDIQLVCDRGELDDDAFALLDEVDLGDLIAASGRVGTTRRGELSVFAERWAMLTKSLRPLPEKWHGLKDPDLQQRRRYLHLIADEQPRRYVAGRAAMLRALRETLHDRGFVEFEGPILQTVAGGANARPFTTFHEALGIETKLRISLELYLKRLLVGGIERVYELGRNFRNEGIDRDHNPEFTMLEAYQAYGDYHTMMELSEELVRSSARAVAEVIGRDDALSVPWRGDTIDLAPPFRRLALLDAVSEAAGERVTLDRPDLGAVAARLDVPIEDGAGPGAVVLEIYEKRVEKTLIQPTFVMDYPREVSPLARPHRAIRSSRSTSTSWWGRGARHGVLRAHRPDRATSEVRAAGSARVDRGGAASAGRGLPPGAGTRHAARRRARPRRRSTAHDPHGRAVAPRPDHVPDASSRGGLSHLPRRT